MGFGIDGFDVLSYLLFAFFGHSPKGLVAFVFVVAKDEVHGVLFFAKLGNWDGFCKEFLVLMVWKAPLIGTRMTLMKQILTD